ncbi:FUSC family protein [[Clostridium] dakarense]|uniref:FUSC family protein n=1 Tax=Faecalimicrobium dakarense TaxID=1301100 RepID=UPI0004AF1F70|nr:FUSC family protein [[Clostridium] dakarense]
MKGKIASTTLLFILIVGFIVVFQNVFGSENTLIGVAGITAALSLIDIDYTLYPIKNTIKFVILEVLIGISAFVASLNPIASLVGNFVVIFSLIYLFTYDTKKSIYVPFTLGYLFILYSPVKIEDMPLRIAGLAFCGLLIMVVQMLANRNKFWSKTQKSIMQVANDLKEKIDLIINKEDVYKIEEKHNEIYKNVRNISGKIYERRLKRIDESNLYEINLGIVLSFESINITLNKIQDEIENIKKFDEILVQLKKELDYIIKYINNEITVKELSNNLKLFIKDKSSIDCYLSYELKENISLLNNTLEEVELKLNKEIKSSNIPYSSLKEYVLKRNFNKDSLKFSFAFRSAIIISIGTFIVSLFSINHGKWLIFTLFAVLQPYLELSRAKGRDRILGSVIGVLIFEIIFSIVKDDSMRMVVIFIVGYLSNYPTKYNQKMIFTTISSLGAASIGSGIDLLALDRLSFIIIGTIIAMAANKFILPYKISSETKELVEKSIKINKQILNKISHIKINNTSKKEFNDLILVNKLINDKISINNNTLMSQRIEEFLDNQRVMMNNVNFLINSIMNNNIKDLDISSTCENASLLNNKKIKEEDLKDQFYSLKSNIEKFVFIDIFEIFKNLNRSYEISEDIK